MPINWARKTTYNCKRLLSQEIHWNKNWFSRKILNSSFQKIRFFLTVKNEYTGNGAAQNIEFETEKIVSEKVKLCQKIMRANQKIAWKTIPWQKKKFHIETILNVWTNQKQCHTCNI